MVVPDNLKYHSKALLVIARGHKQAKLHSLGLAYKLVAKRLGAAVVVLNQVPNEPLFGGKVEDELMAYSFKQHFTDAAILTPGH